MKKVITVLAAIALFSNSTAFSQNKTTKQKSSYVNIAFVTENFSLPTTMTAKSDYGVAVSTGKTYFLHQEPIGDMLKFGIDATWIDLNYGKYSMDFEDFLGHNFDTNGDMLPDGVIDADASSVLHQLQVSMQVGLSFTVDPIDKLSIHGYFRYAPTYAAQYDAEDEIYGGYSTNFVTGGTVYYGRVGLGAEYRFGGGDLSYLGEQTLHTPTISPDFSAVRIHVSVKF